MEGAAILTAVLAVATVTASNDYSKEQQFRALNAVKEDILIKVHLPSLPPSPPLFLRFPSSGSLSLIPLTFLLPSLPPSLPPFLLSYRSGAMGT